MPRLAPRTINRHLDNLAGLFTRLHAAGVLRRNPFAGVRYNQQERARDAKTERRALADAEMCALLQSPVMVGRGVYHDRRGREHVDEEAYWLWLLIIFHGMRAEESAQLEVADLFRFDGIWCLRVCGGDRRSLETLQSRRTVPVADIVLQLGLVEVAAARRRAGHARLFPQLGFARGPQRRPGAAELNRYSSLSTQVLQRMNDYLRRLDIAPGATVYSVRHSFVTKLGNTALPDRVVDELVGHAPVGETWARYFKGTELPTLKRAIDSVDYGIALELHEGSRRIAPPPAAGANDAAADAANGNVLLLPRAGERPRRPG